MHTSIPELPRDTPAHWQNAQRAEAASTPDLDHWWHSFNDPQLDALIERAVQENLTVQIAADRLQAARSVRHAQRGAFWPNLNFRTYVETAPNARTGYLEVGLDSTWEFGFFGRDTANKRINLADENLAIIDVAAAKVSVSAEVARNYIELRTAQARARVLQDAVAERRRLALLAQKRLSLRLGSPLDVDRAEGELQQALGDAAEPALTVVQTTQALAVLLGSTELTLPPPAGDATPHLPAVDFAETPADLLRTRADIRRAEQNVVRAAGDLGVARADLWPKLGLAGTLISSTALTGDFTFQNDFVPIAGPSITIPLVDWGARRELVNAREKALHASVLAYREAVLEGVAEAQTALAQFAAKSAQLDTSNKGLSLDERSAQTAQTLQRIGLGDGQDAATAELAVVQARLAQNLAERDRALAFIAVYKSFGGTIPPMAKGSSKEGVP